VPPLHLSEVKPTPTVDSLANVFSRFASSTYVAASSFDWFNQCGIVYVSCNWTTLTYIKTTLWFITYQGGLHGWLVSLLLIFFLCISHLKLGHRLQYNRVKLRHHAIVTQSLSPNLKKNVKSASGQLIQNVWWSGFSRMKRRGEFLLAPYGMLVPFIHQSEDRQCEKKVFFVQEHKHINLGQFSSKPLDSESNTKTIRPSRLQLWSNNNDSMVGPPLQSSQNETKHK